MPMSATLAQITPNPPKLRSMPEAPIPTMLLLENPWILAGVLTLTALGALVILNSRGKARLGLITAGIAAAVAAAVVLIASAITTDRESIRRRTSELIDAIARADATAVDRLLAPVATAGAEGRFGVEFTRDELLDEVRAARANAGAYRSADGIGVLEYRIREIRAGLASPTIGRTQANVVITPSASNFPTGTWWELDWDKHPDGSWKVRRVELVWVAGIPGIGPR